MKIAIIGKGNVGTALSNGFGKKLSDNKRLQKNKVDRWLVC